MELDLGTTYLLRTGGNLENWLTPKVGLRSGTVNVTGPPGALSFDVKPEIAQEKSL